MIRIIYPVFMMSLLCATANTYACEPAALNWQQLYQDYDANKNMMIEKSEWQHLIQLKNQPYTFAKRSDPQDPHHLKVFQKLDANQDGRLSEDELSSIYLYLPNPCDGWGETWAVQESAQSSAQPWWEKLFDRLRTLW